jgi:hypothetical protein
MTEFLSCRPNLEVAELAPAARFLRDVLDFEVDVDEPDLGLVLLHRGAVASAYGACRPTGPGGPPGPGRAAH